MFHFFNPNYLDDELTPVLDKRYVSYAENGEDVVIPGKLTTSGINTSKWYVPGVNGESMVLMSVMPNNATGKYVVNMQNDTVLSGMNDIMLGAQSMQSWINYTRNSLNDKLDSYVYYNGWIAHDTSIVSHEELIRTLQEQMNRNFAKDEERFNFHNQDVGALIQELAGIHTQIEGIEKQVNDTLPGLDSTIDDLTNTVSETYSQFLKHQTTSNQKFADIDASLTNLSENLVAEVADLSTYTRGEITTLTNVTAVHTNTLNFLQNEKVPAIDASLIDHETKLGTHTTQIQWLYDSAEAQDTQIGELIDQITIINNLLDNNANADHIISLINTAEENAKNYTDEQLKPYNNLLALGIMTQEDKTKLDTSINKKVDTSVYAADVSVITYSLHNLNKRIKDIQINIDNIGSGSSGGSNVDLTPLETRISNLETQFTNLLKHLQIEAI